VALKDLIIPKYPVFHKSILIKYRNLEI